MASFWLPLAPFGFLLRPFRGSPRNCDAFSYHVLRYTYIYIYTYISNISIYISIYIYEIILHDVIYTAAIAASSGSVRDKTIKPVI